MPGADLYLVPPPKAGSRRRRRLALRPRETWTLYDLLIPGLAGVWVWWVMQELVGPILIGLVVLGICLVQAKGGGPRG